MIIAVNLQGDMPELHFPPAYLATHIMLGHRNWTPLLIATAALTCDSF
jgi:hypothetical protein